VLKAIEVLRGMNAENVRKVPADAPIDFIKNRWEKLVFTEDGLDLRYYELCTMSELKNALRSGDVSAAPSFGVRPHPVGQCLIRWPASRCG
jgi:hypothetical protein